MPIVSIVVLAAHLIVVDLAMIAPLACIWLARRQMRRGDALAGWLKIRLARQSLVALAVGIGLGTAQVGLLWLAADQDFFAAVGRVPAGRLWFSLAELVFYAGCMGGYLWLERGLSRRPVVSAVLAVLAATDLMYHFPPLFSILGLMSSRPELIGRELTGALYRELLIDPEVMAMVLHVWLAAVAVTAVAIMRSVERMPDDIVPGATTGPAGADAQAVHSMSADSTAVTSAASASVATPSIATTAARFALGATLLQLPVGMWVLFTVPDRPRDALLGADVSATLLFVLSLVAALGLVHHLAASALGDASGPQVRRKAVRRIVALTLTVVLLMSAALVRTRARGRLTSAGLAAAAFALGASGAAENQFDVARPANIIPPTDVPKPLSKEGLR
jgi:hypothetical protein